MYYTLLGMKDNPALLGREPEGPSELSPGSYEKKEHSMIEDSNDERKKKTVFTGR